MHVYNVGNSWTSFFIVLALFRRETQVVRHATDFHTPCTCWSSQHLQEALHACSPPSKVPQIEHVCGVGWDREEGGAENKGYMDTVKGAQPVWFGPLWCEHTGGTLWGVSSIACSWWWWCFQPHGLLAWHGGVCLPSADPASSVSAWEEAEGEASEYGKDTYWYCAGYI